MQIAKNTVVTFEYTLRNDAGEVLDASEPGSPISYLHGHSQIVPGLESALLGKGAGDALNTVVPPADGYGERRGRTVTVPRAELPTEVEPEPGMALHAVGPDGSEAVLWVDTVRDDQVVLSFEHPLAGVTLHFDVKVHDVREATVQELAHGHAHGAHGHEHHH